MLLTVFTSRLGVQQNGNNCTLNTLLLILVAVFPDPMFWLAELLGIQSPANMVFLFVIFILLIKTFNLTLEISQLQYKIQELVQKIALDENKKNKEADKEEK